MAENKNIKAQQLIQMANMLRSSNKSESEQRKEFQNFAEKNMNREQTEALHNLLNDKNALNNLLASEAAKKLMEKLSDKKK